MQNFMNELLNYLDNSNKKEEISNETSNPTISDFREENVLYQVVDIGINGIYLQNTKNNIVFEENNIPKELQEKLENDFILRYKNGEYIFEEQLTDDFFNSLVSIKEYEEIKNKFIQESDISEIDPNTKFIIISREEEYSILKYGDDIIKVPNVLLPYFANINTVLKYENGKFILSN